MPLRRAVYRAAFFNLTLIKHFKCSYRNGVTNPNSTLLTERRHPLQSLVYRSFYGQSCTTGLPRKAAMHQAAEALDGVERVTYEDAESLTSRPSLTLC